MNNKLSAYLLVAFMLSACSYNNSGSERKEISSEQEKIETTLLPEATPIFEVAYVHPQPVITRGDRGTAHNKFGFEGGRAHKINGTYHLLPPSLMPIRFGYPPVWRTGKASTVLNGSA